MVDINELKYYGQWYRGNDEDYNWWWFSIYDEKVYNVDELMEKFSFETYEDILVAEGYIPLWKTDLIKVTRDFLILTKDKKSEKFLQENSDEKVFGAFDTYVMSNDNYLTSWWYEYEDAALVNDAIKWCRKHGIPYKM